MRSHLSWLLAGAAVAPLAAPALAHADPFRFHFDHVLGTSLDLTAVAPDAVTALMAVTAARREIARLDKVLSAWRADSELEQLNRSDAARVSPELFEVISRSEGWRAATDGAFDCRMGGPLKLWREAGIRTLPGGYLAHNQEDGRNPGADFIRIAMVQDQEVTAEALHRIVAVLD